MHSDHRLLDRLSRRAFLRSTASFAALAQLRSVARATVQPKQNTFAYVACGQRTGGEDGLLQVFSLHGRHWTAIQRVPTRAPACVILSPDQQTLYVANQVGTHKGLARGTVEAFRIDPSDGHLRLLGRQALSLAATYPRQMALSPDGALLAVAAEGGAIYNLLPVSTDGGLDRPCSIFKQLDCAPHARLWTDAPPHRLLFDTTGSHLLSSGFGGGDMSTFVVAQSAVRRRMVQRTVEVEDPGACGLHPDGSILYVWHKAGGNLSCYRYDSVTGTVGETVQQISMPTYGSDSASPKALAVHPSGRMLYTAEATHSRLQAWHIHAQSGLLSRAKRIELGGAPGNEIVVAPNGESLFLLDCSRGLIQRIAVDSVTGEPSFVEEVATIHGAQSMVFKTL
jgi:6-phosphogluconolactonase